MNLTIHKTGKSKPDRPKAKETAEAWISTPSGYFDNEFVSWNELPRIINKETKLEDKNGKASNRERGKPAASA